MNKKNIDLIRQALSAAESSIKLAKQLLNEVESGKDTFAGSSSSGAKNLPGIIGTFDGENMVTSSGEIFPVPANYASKSKLVVGDTLKMVEEGGEKRFKQIEHLKRYRTNGIITKKDGKWRAITPEGSYKVLPAAIEYFKADVGSEVILHLPANNLKVAYAALESIKSADNAQQKAKTVEKESDSDKAAVSEPVKELTKVEKKQKETIAPEKEVSPKPTLAPKPTIEVKVESKPKQTTQTKPDLSPVATKPEPTKTSSATDTKPSGAPKTEVSPAQVTPNPATVPMEIAPEEDELT